MLGDSSIHRMANDHSLGSEVIDSRKTVAELSSMIREEEPTYIYTHTCNQKIHFRVAPIRGWIDARCDEITYDGRISPSLKESKIRHIHECGTSILTRSWLRAGKYYVDYIVNSGDKPLGTVKKYWWR